MEVEARASRCPERHEPISGVLTPAGETLTLFVTDDGYVWGYVWEGDRGTISPMFGDGPDDDWDPWADPQTGPPSLDRAFDWLETI